MDENIVDLSFEEALLALEETVAQLESGDLTLEESLALFERGQHLALRCNTLLEQAELRIEMLTADGEIVPVDPDNDTY